MRPGGVASAGEEGLEARHVGVDDLAVAGEGEDQCDVDAATCGGHRFDGRYSGVGGGDLDHQVGPVDPPVEVLGVVDGGGGVVGDFRRHLYGDEPVASATGFVERREQVGGSGYVGDDQFPVGVFERRAGLEKPVGCSV